GAFTNFILQTQDGGNTWKDISTDGGTSPHTDVHAMVLDRNNNLVVGTDGGVWRHERNGSGQPIWNDINGNLQTMTINSLNVGASDPNLIYAGTEDNGTLQYSGSQGWETVDGGDGGEQAVDPLDPSNAYHVTNGSLFASHTGGSVGTYTDILDAVPPQQ